MPDSLKERPLKQHGLAHLLAATRYSLSGLRHLLGETAFRHELMAGGAMTCLLALAGASAGQLVAFAILVLATLCVEALNTALEQIVDRLSPDYSEFARVTKDLGSFAVMCLLLANGLFAAWVLWTALW
ncbi:MAG: diacylglycerol kinase [Nitratireductor sp.]|nr:diacylglycerol kinase [Nitratireductor sp.]